MNDLRFGLRVLRRSPGFTLAVIATLGIGIGANTAIFSIVRGVLLRPLAYDHPERLLQIWETFPNGGTGAISPPNLRDWRAQNHSLEYLVAYSRQSRTLQNVDTSQRIPAVAAEADLFAMLGVQPILGRTFAPHEDAVNRPLVAVISEAFWRRSFGADPAIVGKNLTLNGDAHTVIGVMPAGFQFPPGDRRTALWAPLRIPLAYAADRSSHFLHVTARLRPGVSLESAQAEMSGIERRIAEENPASQTGNSVHLIPLREEVTGKVSTELLILLGAVGLVLLIACVNVANLLLARAAGRTREAAIRASLGAGRRRLVTQFLVESFVLALAGACAGCVAAVWSMDGIIALMAGQIPRTADIRFDGSVLAFALSGSVVSAILFGMAPALQGSHVQLSDALKAAGARGVAGGGRPWLKNLLVAGEIALAFILTIGAGLLLKTFWQLRQVPSGLVPDRVLTLLMTVWGTQYTNGPALSRFYEQVIDRIENTAGVQSAAVTTMIPLQDWGWNADFQIEGKPVPKAGDMPIAEIRYVSPHYFRSLGIALRRGREFVAGDRLGAPEVVMINETLARRYFPNENPVGMRILRVDKLRTIVGVAGDVRQAGLHRAPLPELYIAIAQVEEPEPLSGMSLLVRGALPAASLTGAVRAAIHSVDPNQPIDNVKTMDQVVADSLADRRLYLWLLGAFAAIALILAMAGIYGVMAYLVAQRTQEFGVRVALGARRLDVLGLVLGHASRWIAVGLAAGICGAAALTRFLGSLLAGVSPLDPALFAGVACLLAAVAIAACLVPAARATRIDPLAALRYE